MKHRSSKPLFLLGLSLISLSLCSLTAQAAPVGMAAELKGSVQLESDGKKAPLKLLGRVESGDVVRCGAGAQAIIVLFSGGARYQIGANQSATVGATEVVGASKMAGLNGASAAVAQKLGTARVGAVMARPAQTFERLKPDFPGWLSLDKPKFEWLPLGGATTYTFTLFDQYDNVVWMVRTDKLTADYPADAPALREQRPYLWRLSGVGSSGKPVQDSRYGLVTFLSSADSVALTALVANLKTQAQNSTDNTPLLMLIEAYRDKGVIGRALEVFDEEKLRNVEGIADAKNDVFNSLSPFARGLRRAEK